MSSFRQVMAPNSRQLAEGFELPASLTLLASEKELLVVA